MHADLFDEQAEEFLRLFGALGVEDHPIQLVGKPCESSRVRRRVRFCGKSLGEVGFVAAKRSQPFTVAADARFEERR